MTIKYKVLAGIGLFVLGFSVSFVLLGGAFGQLGSMISGGQNAWVTQVLGVLVIIMGVVFMGGFGWLQRDAKIHAKPPAGLWGAPLLGITFGLGWAPCIGPTYSAVQLLSMSGGSSAAKGATRPETATQARPAAGTGLQANQLRGLADELQRRWNPNCDVEGGRDVQVKVTFTLGMSGQVVGEVSANGAERSANAVVQTAADRAIRAVYAASPFRNLTRDFYGQRISVNFNAREACS